MKTKEEIILSKGIKFSEKRSPRDFNLTLIAMEEYASQFYSDEQVREAMTEALIFRATHGKIRENDYTEIIRQLKVAEPKEPHSPPPK